jgi:hypothetical protein
MKILVYISTVLFLFTLSWNGNFIINDILRPYVITAILFIVISFINIIRIGYIPTRLIKSEDALLLYFILVLLFLSIFTPVTNVNYIATYAFIFVFFMSIITNNYWIQSQYSSSILRINSYISVWSVFFLLFVYILKVYYLIDLTEILPKLKDGHAIYLGGISRNYGFSSEPGSLSFYVETVLLYGVYYFVVHISKSILFSLLISLLFTLLLVTTFSAGSFASLALSITVYGLLTIRQRSIYFNSMFLIIFILFMLMFFYGTNLTEGIIEKITLGQTESSVGRMEKWMLALDVIPNAIFVGIGLGQTTVIYDGSFLSYYITLISETGIFPILIILTYFLLSYIRIFKHRCSNFILIPLGAGIIHLAIISTIYYPYVFILIALSRFTDKECFSRLLTKK